MCVLSSRHLRLPGLAAVLATVAMAGLTPTTCVLLLAPALIAFAILLLGFVPGAQVLDRMRASRVGRRMRRAPRTLPARMVVVVRRMAAPATSALAMRPPPRLRAGLG